MRQTLSHMLTLTDIALPSFDDEAAHFGDADAAATLRRMAAAGVGEVVVKDGAGPVRLGLDGTLTELDTPPVQGIRDTTGAGDAFNAGYLAGRVLGLDARTCVRAGQRLAATVLVHHGARASREAMASLPPLADQA